MTSTHAAWVEALDDRLLDLGTPFQEHWDAWRKVPPGTPAWVPDTATLGASNIKRLMDAAGVATYQELHAWSARERADYWQFALDALGVAFDEDPAAILDDAQGVEDPAWLPGATFNAAAQCFHAPSDKIAIRQRDEAGAEEVITYGELHGRVASLAAALQRHGLQEGDGVALFMPMTIDCVAMYLAAVWAGLHVVSIPDSFAPDEVATRLRLGSAKVVVTVPSFQRGGKDVQMAEKARAAAGERDVLSFGPAEGCIDVSDWQENEGVAHVPMAPDAVSNILFSSGTTGEPKAIPWTHLTPLKAAADGHYHQDIHPNDVVAWPTNVGWMMGPWLIYATFLNQATMMLYVGAPAGDGFLDWVRESDTTMLGVVPAMVRSWKATHETTDRLAGVRVFSSTGEASNAHDYLWLMSRTQYRAPIIEYCGGTEIGGGHITGTVVQPQIPATFSTPALGLDFIVLDDDGKPAKPGSHGQIFLVPPSIGLSQRLLNGDHHEEYYAGCPTGPDGQVLRRHGDEIHVLPEGYYAAGGRADDTMNLGGIKVSSVELENAMNGADGVVETAAVAVRPKDGGADQLVVFVVGDQDDEASDLKGALQARIKQHLNPLFRIHDVVLVDALPRTASNKVMRRVLRDQYVAA